MTFEHFGWIAPDENPNHKSTSWNEREDDYSSVAFWYQTGEPTFTARAPDARQRKLPSLDPIIVWAHEFSGAEFHGEGNVMTQTLDLYPDPQLLYTPTSKESAWLELPVNVTNKQPYRLLLNLTKSYDFGKYQAYFDGVKVSDPIDLYSPKVVNEEAHLLDFWPDPGPHKLRLECVGKNQLSSGFYCGIESVRLRERRPRVAAFGYDKQRDWRKDPPLYQ